MANCPNCGAEVAPTVLSCARCRMPLSPDHGHQAGTWGETALGGGATATSVGSPLYRPDPQYRPDPSYRPEEPPPPRSIPLDQGQWSAPPPQQPSPPPPAPGPAYGQQPSGQGYGQQPTYAPPTSPSYGQPYGPPQTPEPPADPREERQRRNTISLIVLGAVVLAIALISGIVVLVSLNNSTADPTVPVSTPTRAATGTAPPPPSQSTGPASSAPPSSAATSPSPSAQKGPTTTPADTKWCSSTVGVPASGTSCEFAGEVAKAVAAADPAAVDLKVKAHSPVTKKDYTMTCVRNSVLTTCTGGNNATVWIRNGG